MQPGAPGGNRWAGAAWRAAPYGRVREPVQAALVLLAAIAVSPLGYLLIGRLSALTDRAAAANNET